ncbi:hypothetical protein C2S53_005520 [Perilla frutescens var. hirtella]|uniref:Uncharacterized protein n=1 Tax=Perilla frutescens var. hirtella TaxID=608512 RepID=A0AAD4INU6_PERFH|nr:hypothetical protein C2S53_005520 [Perilla frutescens var. hirtella]KAH6815936.1 hypothetical protein C2S51_020756 [Perilla frutescens var. frutescens]
MNRKLVKPHTPTPQNLKNYKISFLDNSLSPMNLAVVLYYQSKPENYSQLEESLAKTLVQFYPLAGRYIKNDHLVDCSDQGAEFIEAEALDIELMSLVTKTEAHQLNGDLYPDQYFVNDESAEDPLLSIQATHFPCGGLSIAVSVSHRIFDVPSLATFVVAWSSTTNPEKVVGFSPTFDFPSLLPFKDFNFGINLKRSSIDANNILVKRLLFDKAALTSLKSKIKQQNKKPISAVSAVSAVIAKSLIRLDTKKHGKSRDFVVFQLVNIRERTIPPQPKHACGNLCFTALTPPVSSSGIGIDELVGILDDAVEKSIADHAEILSPDRDGRDIIMNSLGGMIKAFQNPETNFLVFADNSEFGFYEADFGWGEPVWTSTRPQRPRSNTTALMATKDGDGIEAWVHLDENEMRCFEEDEEIKLYAS